MFATVSCERRSYILKNFCRCFIFEILKKGRDEHGLTCAVGLELCCAGAGCLSVEEAKSVNY